MGGGLKKTIEHKKFVDKDNRENLPGQGGKKRQATIASECQHYRGGTAFKKKEGQHKTRHEVKKGDTSDLPPIRRRDSLK